MYVIKALFRIDSNSYTLAEFTLTEDYKWAIATNKSFQFPSVHCAIQFAKTKQIVENRPRLGSDSMPYIVGPKSGRYSIFNGRLYK